MSGETFTGYFPSINSLLQKARSYFSKLNKSLTNSSLKRYDDQTEEDFSIDPFSRDVSSLVNVFVDGLHTNISKLRGEINSNQDPNLLKRCSASAFAQLERECDAKFSTVPQKVREEYKIFQEEFDPEGFYWTQARYAPNQN